MRRNGGLARSGTNIESLARERKKGNEKDMEMESKGSRKDIGTDLRKYIF